MNERKERLPAGRQEQKVKDDKMGNGD